VSRPRMNKTEILLRVKKIWNLRHNDKMTKHLIRAYLAERNPLSGLGLSDMRDTVATYYAPGMDDYVIYPVILHNLKLMAMDLEFDTRYGNAVTN